MTYIRTFLAGMLLLCITAFISVQAAEVNIIADGDGAMLQPLTRTFEENTGIKVNFIKADEGMLARITNKQGEGDLAITAVANELEIAKNRGLLQQMNSKIVEAAVPAQLRDPEGYWTGYQYRVRSIIYNRDTVKPGDLSTYEDLADPKWKGKVCMRSATYKYSIAFVSWMIERHGEDYTRQWLKGLKDNLGIKPNGGDRTQAKHIYDGKCEVAIMNSYYYNIMLSDPVEREWAYKVHLFFPNQNDGGSFILINGIGVLKGAKNAPEAVKFIEFLESHMSQQWLVDGHGVYPARQDVKLSKTIKSYAAEQEGIKDGNPVLNIIPLSAAVKHSEKALRIAEEVGFDY